MATYTVNFVNHVHNTVQNIDAATLEKWKKTNVAYGDSFKLPSTTVDGYNSYWQTNIDDVVYRYKTGSTYTHNFKRSVRLHLRRYKIYTVHFTYLDGSINPNANKVMDETKQFTAPNVPFKAGYTGLGWAPKQNSDTIEFEGGAKVTPSKNATYYPVYGKNNNTLVFYDHNGKLLETINTSVYDEEITMPQLPVLSGYARQGWGTGNYPVTAELKADAAYKVKNDEEFRTVYRPNTLSAAYHQNITYPLKYSDSTLSITVTREKKYGTYFYVADIILDKAVLKERFRCTYPRNTWGLHDTMSFTDNRGIHGILMFNGDYNDLFKTYRGEIRNGMITEKIYPDGRVGDELTNRAVAVNADGTFVRCEDKKVTQALAENAYHTFTFGPLLLAEGKEIDLKPYGYEETFLTAAAPRTLIGQKDCADSTKVEYIVTVTDGRSGKDASGNVVSDSGITFDEARTFMKGKGCKFAYGLDGGGSSEMMFQGKILNNLQGDNERMLADFMYFV